MVPDLQAAAEGWVHRRGGEAMEGLVIFAIFALLALVAGAFGAESRDGEDWVTHRQL